MSLRKKDSKVEPMSISSSKKHSSVGFIVVIIILIIVAILVPIIVWWWMRRIAKKGSGGSCSSTANCANGLTCNGKTCSVPTCVFPVRPTEVEHTVNDLGGGLSWDVTLTWTAVPGATSYIVYLGDLTGFSIETEYVYIQTSNNPITVFNAVPSGMTTFAKVVAVNKLCGTSEPSAEHTITTP